MTKMTIIGAGLVGSLLATMLAQRGFEVEVFEKRPDLRRTDIPAGRSINLALSVRGINALTQVGLKEEVLANVIPMKGRMIHKVGEELELQPYGKDDSQFINSISRGYLNQVLLDRAEESGQVTFHFNHFCKSVDFENNQLTFLNGDKTITHHAKHIIGTDGSASAIRQAMLPLPGFNFSQYYLEYGYKEIPIPPTDNGDYRLEPNALHIWPRETFMMIALPNTDKTFTGTLFLPFKGEYGFESLNNRDELMKFFHSHFPDVPALAPELDKDFFNHPTGYLITIKCSPWNVGGQSLIIGDAAHAIVPFFGQGMNSGFEDCSLLMERLDRSLGDWNQLFTDFSQSRKADADAIAELSFQNFIEMRDSVADPDYVLKRQIERELEARYPDKFVPGYSQVTFSSIPYAEALKRRIQQDEVLSKLCQSVRSLDEVDFEHTIQLMNQLDNSI